MAVNQNATKVLTLVFPNGNRTEVWAGWNTNTQEPIVWQKHKGRETRVTGRNILKLARLIVEALNEDVSTPDFRFKVSPDGYHVAMILAPGGSVLWCALGGDQEQAMYHALIGDWVK